MARELQVKVPRYEDAEVLGLPEHGRIFAITNSQRSKLACPKRWWFRFAEGLRPRSISAPLRYGRGWDLFLEDLNAWWMEHDTDYPGDGSACVWCGGQGRDLAAGWECEECGGTGSGPVARIAAEWRQELQDLALQARQQGWSLWTNPDEIEQQILTLERAAYGYLQRYGPQPPINVRIVAVKLQVAAPVLVPGSGRVYRPELYVVREADGSLRMARTGEAKNPALDVRKVKWPVYQVAELDRVAASRKTGALWVGEFKSSTSPRTYVENQEIDPQVVGYSWILRHVVDQGLLVEPAWSHRGGIEPGTPIAGFTYDCTSSNLQYDPKVLKSGKVSVAKNRTVPSWRFTGFCAEHGLDAGEYSEHIEALRRRFDGKLYVRDWGSLGPTDLKRYEVELYGIARRHLQGYRDAATAISGSDVAARFPRVAICRLPGGSCPYRGPCLEDGEQPREHYEIADPLRWDLQEETAHE